jgi:N-acetyl sugar amidotransferase
MNVFWCKSCLNMSTRPRIEFSADGVCNACQWATQKRDMDWSTRKVELASLLTWAKEKSHSYDCVVPVSGGKDGSYVAHQLKHKYNMNPLCVTVRPPLSLKVGESNLNNFIDSGYTHVQLSPASDIMQRLNQVGFIEGGYPYHGWMMAMKAAVIRFAFKMKIPLIFYGEDGEIEYGGSTETKNNATYSVEYAKRIYFQGSFDSILSIVKKEFVNRLADFEMWEFPSDNELKLRDIKIAHWSYFEPWDPYRNYIVAKDRCGLAENDTTNEGTFTNFAQNDQALAALHYYLMYLKYGFGRATQDAGIEIRRGAMTREQAINLVELFDGQYPTEHIESYLNYFGLSKEEFDTVISTFANRELFIKNNEGSWQPKFRIGETFDI